MLLRRAFLLVVLICLAACRQDALDVPTPPDDSAPTDSAPPNDPAPDDSAVPETLLLWSNAASWGSVVPGAGSSVVIPRGTTITLDVSPPPLKDLMIEGTLKFADTDLELNAGWIMVHGGSFEIGSQDAPFTHRAMITLTGPKEDIMGMGGRLIGVMMGGKLSMYGEERTSWTKLARTANVGDTRLELLEAPTWHTGDEIVLASTDFDLNQAERFVLTAVSGNTVTLDKPLKFMHWGETETHDNNIVGTAKVVDERAEVGLLTRNITIQAIADDLTTTEGFGGHMMIMDGQAYVDGVTLKNMGQSGVMGRYPIHWHLMGDGSRGQYIQNSSIVDSFSRCVTLHGSNGVTVKNNVVFNTFGHCFFLEDGAEFDNVLEGNLGLGIRVPAADNRLLPTDATPTVYWLPNPQNTLQGNVAAGSHAFGFWYAIPRHPTGLSTDTSVYLLHTPLQVFKDNVSHSNGKDGLFVGNGPKADVSQGTEGGLLVYDPRATAQPDGAPLPAVFETFTAYKNRNRGVWTRGINHVVQSPILADNAIGLTFGSRESFTKNGLFVGESRNVGTPKAGEPRSYPNNDDYALRGFEFYDGLVGIEDSYFASYSNTGSRQASALAYLEFTGSIISPLNYVRNVRFAPNTNAVRLLTLSAPADPTKASEDGYRTAVILDQDGSLTGKAGRYVVVDNPFLVTANCTKNVTWNAWVCDETYGNLTVATKTTLDSVTISRDGHSTTMYGSAFSPSTVFITRVIPNQTYTLPAIPGEFFLDLQKISEPLQFAIPFTVKPKSVTGSKEVTSLAAVRSATTPSHYYDGKILHLKMTTNKSLSARVTFVP